MPRFFIANLVLILLLGVCISAWFLYYTDLFPAISGLLALGGLFSWLAFVLRILPAARIKRLQGIADAVLGDGRTLAITLLILAIWVVFCSFRGSIEVQSLQEGSPPVILKTAQPLDDPEELPPGGSLKWNLWTNPFRPREVTVKVVGYPSRKIKVTSWTKNKLFLAASFVRLGILVRPSPDLYIKIHHNPVEIALVVNGHPVASPFINFTGQAFWLGCDSDVDVPSPVIDRWRSALDPQKQYMVADWVHPLSLMPEISDGDSITVTATLGGQSYGGASFVVRSIARPQDFPQEVILDEAPQISSSPAP
jgi:hypothetical protein